MSQVSNNPIRIKFGTLVWDSAHVIVVKDLQKAVVVFQATLSKETSYQKSGETTYRETARLFQVVRILKSDSMKVGDEIKVWREPAYDFEMVKEYHTTGVSVSPEVLTYTAVHPPQGDEWILFLSGPSRHEGVWTQYLDAEEGLAAEPELLDALKAPPPEGGSIRPL